MLVWSISFEFTLDLHLIVLRVLNSKIKHRPHTDSESREVSIYFSWELTFSKVDFYFFLPLTRRQAIYAKVNFFTQDIIFNFVWLQVTQVIKVMINLLDHIECYLRVAKEFSNHLGDFFLVVVHQLLMKILHSLLIVELKLAYQSSMKSKKTHFGLLFTNILKINHKTHSTLVVDLSNDHFKGNELVMEIAVWFFWCIVLTDGRL